MGMVNGDCTPKEHEALQNAVDVACSYPSRCTANQSPAIWRLNIEIKQKCINARSAINNKCYKGGNVGHKQAVDEQNLGIARCEEFLRGCGQ